MGYIKQLSEELIKKIAAGEVIERPASVVKELVENSIDAGATKIEIEVERSGKYIKVSDNGMGIDPDDIDLLFSCHATSKIKYFDDLWNINSLGFRGEALASISAVSKITCKSKHIHQEYGFELKVLDGKISKKSSAISIGTLFEVDDLFYNVPARQKFLKSETTEINHIHEIVLPLALSHPKISFTFKNNKNVLVKSSGSNDLSLAIVELLGNDLQKNIMSISAQNHFLDLNGHINTLEVSRSDRKSLFVFINKRPVKCHIISKAILSAYEGLLPPGKFPVVILNLNFKPKFVDVNVHPAKKEVRYTHPNDVYNLVLHCIQDSISDYYKKEYKEKSVYSVPLMQEAQSTKQEAVVPRQEEWKAPFDLYAPSLPVEGLIRELPPLFSANSLKCKLIYSGKPIANITRIGNKAIFEVGSIFDDDFQVVFSGEIIGERDYQKDFFNHLSELGKEIYKTYSKDKSLFQEKLIQPLLEDEEVEKEKNRKKPSEKILYTVWERDNWTCVYCEKQLLDPKTVKSAIPNANDAFMTYINEEGKEITNHVLREHIASYDHYLPASKLPQFNFDPENLFACCLECNRKKSDSMELATWKPKRQNNWDKPLEIAGFCFSSPKAFSKAH